MKKRRLPKKLNKKGDIAAPFLLIILSFVIAIICILFYMIASETHTQLLENSEALQNFYGDSGNATELINDTVGKYVIALSVLKWCSVAMIFGMVIGVLLSGYLITVNRAYFMIYILFVILAVIIAAPISNAFEEICDNEQLEPYCNEFGLLSYVMSKLPVWIGIVGLFSGLIMFINMVNDKEGGVGY